VAIGLLTAAAWAFFSRRSSLDAALEIDRRFGLKERVSSSLALDPQQADTEIGRALVEDASRRVGRIDVRDQFGLASTRWAWLPLVAATVVAALVFIPDASPKAATSADAAPIKVSKQIKKSADELKRKLAERRKKAEEQGLKEAGDLIKKLEKGVENLARKDDMDRKNAMVKLNDLAKELQQRRQSLGGNEDVRKQLQQLKEIKNGPADQMARAFKDGNFQTALDELQKLQKQLQTGELTPEQQQKLAEQMKQMGDKLQEMIAAHDQAKRDL
jgi:hypothetical protein